MPLEGDGLKNWRSRWIKNWNCFKLVYPNICLFSFRNEFLQFHHPSSLILPSSPSFSCTQPQVFRERENQSNQFPSTNCLLFFISADHTSRINIWLDFRRGGKYLLTLFVNLSLPLPGLCLPAGEQGARGRRGWLGGISAFRWLPSSGCFFIIIHFRPLPQAWRACISNASDNWYHDARSQSNVLLCSRFLPRFDQLCQTLFRINKFSG